MCKTVKKNVTDLAKQESGLAATLLCVDVPWHWEPCHQHLETQLDKGIVGNQRFIKPPEHQPQVPPAAA